MFLISLSFSRNRITDISNLPSTSFLTVLPSSAVSEHTDDHNVTLNCSVSTYHRCTHTVTWLLTGKVNKDVSQSHSSCSSTVAFTTSSLKCEVTDRHSKEVKLFSFNPPNLTSGEKTHENMKSSLK